MLQKQIRRSLILSLIAVSSIGINATNAENISSCDPLTKQAFALCKQGKIQEARELEAKAVTQNPKDWVAHEALSYFSWQQGDVVQATDEAKKAAALGPNQEIIFTNLAQIHEHVYQYSDALPLYDWARRIAPDDWVPWIGMARCFVMNNNSREGYSVLSYMQEEEDQSFDWYYQIGKTYLLMDRPDLAVAPLSKAKSLAGNSQQKADSATQHLLALLRTNQRPRTGSTADDVFKIYHPQDHELYIRGASVLLPPTEPSGGKRFLKMSSQNLTSTKDSDAFFKIGRLFESKADAISYDASARDAWLSNAESAYRLAIHLNPEKSSYHLALAGVLDRETKRGQAAEELTKSQSLDPKDKLAKFLLSEASAPSSKSNLTAVKFNINGVGCGCKIKLIQHALENVSGVMLVVMANGKPYRGEMLIDKSVTPSGDALLQALKSVFPFEYKDDTKAPGVNAEMYFSESIKTTADAVVAAETMKNGDPLQFEKPQMRSGLGELRFELAEVLNHTKSKTGEIRPL